MNRPGNSAKAYATGNDSKRDRLTGSTEVDRAPDLCAALGPRQPGESRLQWYERVCLERGVLAYLGFMSQKQFWDWLRNKNPKGRPRRADVTAALQMEQQGTPRVKIYASLGKKTREEQHALREAMRQRKLRERRSSQASGAVIAQAATPEDSEKSQAG